MKYEKREKEKEKEKSEKQNFKWEYVSCKTWMFSQTHLLQKVSSVIFHSARMLLFLTGLFLLFLFIAIPFDFARGCKPLRFAPVSLRVTPNGFHLLLVMRWLKKVIIWSKIKVNYQVYCVGHCTLRYSKRSSSFYLALKLYLY